MPGQAVDLITEAVIGAAIEVHRELGPGLLESMYHQCLAHELHLRGMDFESEVPLHLIYKGCRMRQSYRLDLVVENRVVLEIKAVKELLPVHKAQVLSYLRLSGKRVGLLLNFHTPVLKNGIVRLVH